MSSTIFGPSEHWRGDFAVIFDDALGVQNAPEKPGATDQFIWASGRMIDLVEGILSGALGDEELGDSEWDAAYARVLKSTEMGYQYGKLAASALVGVNHG
ncbi:MAG TPA: hypothetical protein VFH39_01270 [Candidatus Saccharimonadales bacterium]|nr:hypothetical protein [Candidatus Saccharimonadales bacterium]